jgi:hypothetical protein
LKGKQTVVFTVEQLTRAPILVSNPYCFVSNQGPVLKECQSDLTQLLLLVSQAFSSLLFALLVYMLPKYAPWRPLRFHSSCFRLRGCFVVS